jgi:eukaryotic-like serine/threonine-protein kinase
VLTGEFRVLESALAERYRLVREVGRGGSGIAFLADDLTNGGQVAIKVLRVELAGVRARQRFLREIEYSSSLSHPNILPLLQSGEVEGILYYVMPFVPGGSLQQRLAAEGQLPIPEALRVTRAILEALEYAHASDIVHRDIKPGNVLLDGERVFVADFGIARAIHRSASEGWVSSAGVQVGTPAYMSPEQSAGDGTLDGRSDIYSLGCVLYEMLTGGTPFVGASGTAIVARHIVDPVPPPRTVRQAIPIGVERLVLRALQKSPADRYRNASEMLAALDEASTSRSLAITSEPNAGRRRMARAGIAAVGIAAAVATWLVARPLVFPAHPTDPNVYAVFAADGSVEAQADAAQRLRESLGSWNGVRVVDQFTQQSSLGNAARGPMTAAAVRDAARKLGSGRYVRVLAKPDGDSMRLTATLFDVDSAQLVESSVRTARDFGGADSAFARLAERMLFHDLRSEAAIEPRIGTRSVPARRAYLAGHALLREWNIEGADSVLFHADSLDPRYSQASLWLALVRFWRKEPPSRWRDFAERASTGVLSAQEQPLAAALLAFADGDVVSACESFERLASTERDDGLLWYSAGRCRSRDNAVLADRASPSGWRFRSSYRLALSHYERALRLKPVIYRGLRSDGFAELRSLLTASGNDLRPGRALPPGADQFLAYPTLSHDTLAFFPIPLADVLRQTEPARRFLPDVPAAVRRQREVLRDWTVTWSSNYPQSAEAWEAVAIALEALGDASSLDTIARARGLARTDLERSRVRGTEAWLRVKFSLPGDVRGIRAARLLADSLLAERTTPVSEPKLLASLAALTGRLERAKALAASIPSWPRNGAPPEVNGAAAQLLVHAAMGGSAAELQSLERRLDSLAGLSTPRPGRTDSLIGSTRPEATRALGRDLLARAAVLSYPLHSDRAYSDTAINKYPLFDAFRAWLKADTAFVVQRIAAWRETRRSIPAGDVQVDALLPETLLIGAAVGPRDAAAWIDPTLAALRSSSQMNFLDPIRAAALVRGMALRAELADRVGDHTTAAMWAAAVAELWENCDSDLRPVRDRMRRLTGRSTD